MEHFNGQSKIILRVFFRKAAVDPGRPTGANGKMKWTLVFKLFQVFFVIQFLSNVNTARANNISEWREYMKDKVLRVGIIHVSLFVLIVQYISSLRFYCHFLIF